MLKVHHRQKINMDISVFQCTHITSTNILSNPEVNILYYGGRMEGWGGKIQEKQRFSDLDKTSFPRGAKRMALSDSNHHQRPSCKHDAIWQWHDEVGLNLARLRFRVTVTHTTVLCQSTSAFNSPPCQPLPLSFLSACKSRGTSWQESSRY